MLNGFILLTILVAGLVPGWLLLRLLGASNPLLRPEATAGSSQTEAEYGDWLEWGFASLTIGLVLIGWTAVILAETGWFSISLLVVIWLIVVTLLLLLAKRKNHPITLLLNYPITQSKWERPLLILWFIAALWLFLRPHQFITGAGDGGVYINLGANINRTGRILIQDEGLAELDPSLQEVILRPVRNPVAESYLLPAFYVVDAARGEIVPQFYPLHPVWYAVAFGLGGLQTALLLTGFWAILASLAVYLFVRQISRWQIAFLALIALSLNGIQVWFARYPTSESLTQFLLWAGLWATAVWLSNRPQARVWAFVAGTCLGALFLVRIDVLFIGLALVLVVVWQWRRQQPALSWFAVPLSVMLGHSLIHALWQSQPYFFDLYNYAVLSLARGQTGLLLILAVVTLTLALFAYFFRPIIKLLHRYRRPLLTIIIIGLLGLAVYGWFIRPYYSATLTYNDEFSATTLTKYDHENLLRLGWYLSPLGVWLGVFGTCLLVWRVNWQTAVMLLITLFFTIFYLWQIRNNPTQIYAMRRYMPAVLPLFTIGAAYLIDNCQLIIANYPLRRIVPALLAILWLGSIIWSARGFVSQIDYTGLPEQIAELSAQLGPNAILLWNDQRPVNPGDHLGTPLKFQHGHEIYILRNLEALDDAALVRTIGRWQNNGQAVYWIGDQTWLLEQNMPFTTTTTTITSSVLEGSFEHKPTAVVPIHWVLQLAKLE